MSFCLPDGGDGRPRSCATCFFTSKRTPGGTILALAFLAELSASLYWFHPCAWWLVRRLAILAEAACDDVAIDSTGNRTAYARHLLEIAGTLTGRSSRVAYSAVSMARCSNVEGRINAILDMTRRPSRQLTWTGLALMAIVVAPLVGVTAALRPAMASQTEAESAPHARPADAAERATRLQAGLPPALKSGLGRPAFAMATSFSFWDL